MYDLIRGLRGKRYGFEEVAYLLLLGDLPNEQQLHEFTDCLTKCRALPSNFVRDVIMKESPQQGSDEQPDPQRADSGFL